MSGLGSKEHVGRFLEGGGAGEESRHQPQQLPPLLLASFDLVVCQLLDDLAVDLIPQGLL